MTHISYHPEKITSYFCPFHFWRVRPCFNSQMSRSPQTESVFTKQEVRALREQSGATSWIKQSLAVWGTQEIQGTVTETVISDLPWYKKCGQGCWSKEVLTLTHPPPQLTTVSTWTHPCTPTGPCGLFYHVTEFVLCCGLMLTGNIGTPVCDLQDVQEDAEL